MGDGTAWGAAEGDMDTTRMRSACATACMAIMLALGCGGGEDDEMAPAYTTVPVSAGGGGDDDAEDASSDATSAEGEGTGGEADTGAAGDDASADDAGPVTSGPADGGDDAPPPPGDGPADDAGGPAAECLAQAVTECETCACSTCLAQLQACEQDPGCVAIRMCAQQNMCTGIGCLGPCGDVIDANGGAFGPSAGLASMLSDCVEGGCPAC